MLPLTGTLQNPMSVIMTPPLPLTGTLQNPKSVVMGQMWVLLSVSHQCPSCLSSATMASARARPKSSGPKWLEDEAWYMYTCT